MPETCRASSAPWGAHSGGSYLSVALGWLALFGPRPAFIFSTQRRETTWQQWKVDNRHRGLARFSVEPDGMIDDVPVLQAVPERKKPCWTSSLQWGR